MTTTAVASRKVPSLMFFAGAVFFASLVFAVVTARSLYDDGSYYFMRVLQAGGFTEMLFHRGHAAFLFQLPVVIACKLGVTDLAKLQIAFGIGCFMSWPLALLACHRLAPRHFWLAALACGTGYLNAAFVAVGEHLVTHAFFWPVCFAILFVRPLTPFAAGALLTGTIILIRSYESMLFLGPVLAWLAFRRADDAEKSWQRVVFLLATLLLLISILVALDGTLHPCTSSGPNSFKIGLFSVLAAPGWTISWSAAWLALMLGCWSPKIRGWVSGRTGIFILSASVLVWGAWPLLAPAQLDPYKQYEARFLNLLVPMGLLFVALLIARRPDWMEPPRRQLASLSAALLLAQSLWHLGATEQWRGYLNVWRNLAVTQSGLINLVDSPYWKNPAVGWQATQFVWEMDARDLCIETGPRKIKSLILPGVTTSGEIVHGVLLKQFVPAELPDLKRYGVDYSEYAKAVAQNPGALADLPPSK